MTLHGAKGLEFDVVFLPGWEEEIFPSRLSLDENGNRAWRKNAASPMSASRAPRAGLYLAMSPTGICMATGSTPCRRALSPNCRTSILNANRTLQMGARAGGNIWQGGAQGDDVGASGCHRYGNNCAPDRGGVLYRALLRRSKGARLKSRRRRREGKCNVGDRVFHEKFGPGTVRRVDHDKLEIAFDKAGIKKVMESFVRPGDGG